MKGCDHKFADNPHCLKCGWVPDPLFSLRLALLAHDVNQRDHAPFVAEWTYVEAVITAARALVGVPLIEDDAQQRNGELFP